MNTQGTVFINFVKMQYVVNLTVNLKNVKVSQAFNPLHMGDCF